MPPEHFPSGQLHISGVQWHKPPATFGTAYCAGELQMARFKLETNIDPDVMVIGISCHENDYRLCWALNRQLGLSLTRRDNDIEEPGPRTVSYHSVYEHCDDGDIVRYTLINNHGEAGLLLKDQRSADFFLLADREVVLEEKDLLEQLRTAELVLAVYPIAFSDLKAGHKLLA